MKAGFAWLRRAAWCLVAVLPLATSVAQAAGYALCERGKQQAPIDIVGAQRQVAAPLRFDYHPAPLRIVNDGHTVRVRYANASRLLIGRDSHTLQQFHFHVPGGDKLQGEEFPMAMHFLHKSRAGQLISLTVLFRLGAENAALATLLPRMPSAGTPEQRLADTSFDPAALLPTAHGYYAYDGSLTAPPCTEGVRWLVLKQPQQLSAAQLARLNQLFARNARPVQPLHGRVVTESP